MSGWISGTVLRLRNSHVLAWDVVVFASAPGVALALHLDGSLFRHAADSLVLGAVMAGVGVVVFWRCALYRRLWRFAGIDEAIRLGWALVVTSALLVAAHFGFLVPAGLIDEMFPRWVPVLVPLVMAPLVVVIRVAPRIAQRFGNRLEAVPKGRRAVVAGAGEAGVMIVRGLQERPGVGVVPAAFVDDDPAKAGLRIRGLEVEGRTGEIAEVARKHGATLAIIAMTAEGGGTIRRISGSAEEAGLEIWVTPGEVELLDGTVKVNQLRRVRVEDLLRRPPIVGDPERVRRLVAGQRILVTGAGGSIGHELCRQLRRYGPESMLLVGHGENSIFAVEQALRAEFRSSRARTLVETAIADIRDRDRMDRVFNDFGPGIVFHAAAHKHVPLMEANPEEAVTNNVLGTRIVSELAERHGVERFVMISTDKAVRPTSVMGGTKRVAEMIVHRAAERTGRPFVVVRFGNVLGSRGSVTETFRAQMEGGGPLTVTHPEMERYFMTIPEAVQLSLQASALGTGGEVFVLDMGRRVRILDLARDLIRLSGLREGQDIGIEFTGLRPGEKLHEELLLPEERYERTDHEGILVCRSAMEADGSSDDLDRHIDALAAAALRGDAPAVVTGLMQAIPDYQAVEPVPLTRQGAAAPEASRRPPFRPRGAA